MKKLNKNIIRMGFEGAGQFKGHLKGPLKGHFIGTVILVSIFWLCGAAFSLAYTSSAYASSAYASSAHDSPVHDSPVHDSGDEQVRTDKQDKDGEYSFNWLDPDKKIYVLQNRKYLRGGHPILSLMGGTGFSNPYKITYNADARFAYYMNETWGVELFYTATSNYDNSTLTALGLAAPTVMPQIREIVSQIGGMVHYVPWYAKINVYNNIIYFDWYFGLGAGMLNALVDQRTSTSQPSNFVTQNLYGLFLSSGHEYHLSQNFLARLDVTGAIYQAPVGGLTGVSSWFSNFSFGLGLGCKL